MCAKKFTEPNFNNYNLAQAMVENNKSTFVGRGHITLGVNSDDGTIFAGSQVECGNSLYFCDQDELPAGVSESSSHIYIVPDNNSASFIFSATPPVFNPTKGAFYDGDNRAVAQNTSTGWVAMGSNGASADSTDDSGNGLNQCLQNIVNGHAGNEKVPITNGFDDDFISDEDNVIFNLANNYAQGSTSISLAFVQPETVGDFKQKYAFPFRTQIYDGTNKSYAVLTATSASDTETTASFSLAMPLVSMNGSQVAYSTSGTISKLKMLDARNGSGTVPSSLTGQAQEYPENLNVKYLPSIQINRTLNAAVNFNPTKQYKVNSVPDVNTIIVQTDTNDSTMFPLQDAAGNLTEILAYNLVSNAHKKFTLYTPATYSSDNLTFKVNESTAGLGTTAWYIIKSPILSARVEDISQAGELVRAEIEKIICGNNAGYKFSDNFNRPDSEPGGLWGARINDAFNALGSFSRNTWQIRSNRLASSIQSTGWNVIYSRERYQFTNQSYSYKNGWEISWSGELYASYDSSKTASIFAIMFGTNPSLDEDTALDSIAGEDTPANTGVGFRVCAFSGDDEQSSRALQILANGNIKSQQKIILPNANVTVQYSARAQIKNGLMRIKWWFDNNEPLDWTVSWKADVVLSETGKALKAMSVLSIYNGSASMFIDNFVLRQAGGFTAIYSLASRTGNKLTTSLSLPTNSANESPTIGGIASYLG
jgi:hypothetical protein